MRRFRMLQARSGPEVLQASVFIVDPQADIRARGWGAFTPENFVASGRPWIKVCASQRAAATQEIGTAPSILARNLHVPRPVDNLDETSPAEKRAAGPRPEQAPRGMAQAEAALNR